MTISIHALVKRATKRSFKIRLSRSISIHALVKRATEVTLFPAIRTTYFNPRPREEGDVGTNVKYAIGIISIHALVKRATLLRVSVPELFLISIHALVKRATPCHGEPVSRLSISIHALVKRATIALIAVSLA